MQLLVHVGCTGLSVTRCTLCSVLLQMRDTVRQVAHLFPTAIISGRGRDKVEAFVQLPELFYAGSHGMDIAGPRVSLAGVLAGVPRADAAARLAQDSPSPQPQLYSQQLRQPAALLFRTSLPRSHLGSLTACIDNHQAWEGCNKQSLFCPRCPSSCRESTASARLTTSKQLLSSGR
jgi:hypothetical protein